MDVGGEFQTASRGGGGGEGGWLSSNWGWAWQKNFFVSCPYYPTLLSTNQSDNWSEQSLCTSLGRCRQNKVATIIDVFCSSFWSGFFCKVLVTITVAWRSEMLINANIYLFFGSNNRSEISVWQQAQICFYLTGILTHSLLLWPFFLQSNESLLLLRKSVHRRHKTKFNFQWIFYFTHSWNTFF